MGDRDGKRMWKGKGSAGWDVGEEGNKEDTEHGGYLCARKKEGTGVLGVLRAMEIVI